MKQTIFRSWLVKLLAASALMAVLGLGVGAWLLARLEVKLSALRFEQPEIDLRQSPAIKGDPIDVIAQLHNYGKVPVRITDMTPCCGAQVVTESAGEAVAAEIAPGASVPIHLRIGTLQGGGEAIKHLQVEGQTTDGLELAPAEVVVYAYILATLTAHPQSSSFIVHEEELSAPIKQTVVLADLWPGDGLPIKSITSTLGDKLHYQLIPARGEIEIAPRMLHKRYNLELSLTLDPSKTAFDHTVTITPDHPKAKPVEVRLAGRIIPRCGLDTDSVAFCGEKPGQGITRRIEYHYRAASDREIHLVKAPSCVRVSIADIREGLKEILLTCTLPDCERPRAEEVRFEFGRDKRNALLPVFLSCQAHAQAQ